MKFNSKIHYIILFFLFINLYAAAQISVSFPVSRAVFQRNNQNRAYVNIVGNYSEKLERVDARLLPMANGQGTETDWQVIDNKPKAGNFFGRIEGQGGWYKLEIRAIKNGTTIQTISIEKVGIGEVFICAGQSNSEGVPDKNPKSAIDDRVNAGNWSNSRLQYPLPEVLEFTKLTANVAIAPAGNNAWCWGELGDKIVQRFNVPVMFFNCGLSRTAIINWRESAEGILSRRYDDNGDGQTHFPLYYPYNNLRGTLNYYASLLGVRALLWQQGETNNSRTEQTAYQSDLQKVINYSRQDFDDNLSWVVARTSRSYLLPPDQKILNAQNNIINASGNNVFPGPETDILQVNRPDGIHFGNVAGHGDGLSILANAWNTFLNDNFFSNSRPILAKDILAYDVMCNADNNALISFPTGFRTYEWSNGNRSNSLSGNGNFSVKVYDPRGNRRLTPSFSTSWLFPTSRPFITADKPLEFCAYDSARVELRGNGSEFVNYLWSTGERTERIIIKTGGNFTTRGINEFGCLSAESNTTTARTQPLPLQPIITSNNEKSVCEGSAITLSSDTGNRFLWSNGETSRSITLNKVGEYELSVQTISDFGCFSPRSDAYKSVIKPKPIQPSISQVGTFTLLAEKGDFINTDKFEWQKENNLINTTSTPTIKITESGNFKVTTVRSYQVIDNKILTCKSTPSTFFNFIPANVEVMLYPNPVASEIISLETKATLKNLHVEFIDLNGKILQKELIEDSTQKHEIKLNSLPNGAYLVRIFNNDFEKSLKLNIQK